MINWIPFENAPLDLTRPEDGISRQILLYSGPGEYAIARNHCTEKYSYWQDEYGYTIKDATHYAELTEPEKLVETID